MTTNELHSKLKEAYSNSNLNKITVTLIRLYKEEQFGTLRQIAEMISESANITIDTDSKNFSAMMMLYHPDRGNFHRNEIERRAADNDHDGLLSYAHILLLSRIEEIASTLTSYEDIDYSPVYEWDIDLNAFTIIDDQESVYTARKTKRSTHHKGYTFYEGIEMRMLGTTNIGFPSYYLEDLDEIEMSQSDICDLEGIQYCIHAVKMDLSENSISDLTLLWNLTNLEELNLSGNRIETIENLANLRNLKSLNLSHNEVKDISYLSDLPKLEFVDLCGTKVPDSQIKALEESGVVVSI
jgi:Leucine-rich repeat (LRR) protein